MRLVFWKHQSDDSIENGRRGERKLEALGKLENGRRRGRKWRFTDSEGLLQ